MRSATGRVRPAYLLLLAVLILTSLPSGAGAQDPESRARLRLISIPITHGAGDDLGVKVRVSNPGPGTLDGFRLTVGAGDLIRSRSELHGSFTQAPIFTSFTLDFPSRSIPAGAGQSVSIDTPVAELASLGTEGGVHALSLSLFSIDDSFTPLDSLTTQLMIYPSEPEEPLNLVPLLSLNPLPGRGPDGAFAAEDGRPNPMESAIDQGGWLRAVVEAADAGATPQEPPEPPEPDRGRGGNRQGGNRSEPKPPPPPPDPLHMGFAPTPRLIEELAAMSDGYVRAEGEDQEQVDEDSDRARAAADVLETIGATAGREGVQPILVPYSFPDLPAMDEELTPGDIGLQLTEAITVLSEAIDLQLGRSWVFPPAGRMDASSLQALQTAGVTDGAFFANEALEEIDDPSGTGCPIAVLSFVCAVRVQTDVGGPMEGYVFDRDLQQRMSELTLAGGGRLEIQRALAETAMVHAEQPGIAGRVLLMNIPSAWHPTPRAARTFFDALRDAPWLRTVTPEEGLERSDPPVQRQIVDDVSPIPEQPDQTYFDSITSAQAAVDSFSSFIGERGPRDVLERLRRNVLVSQGRSLWNEPVDGVERAAAYATESREEALGEMAKVRLGVPGQTTFTSRTGTLDVSLFNETGYPIEAEVTLRSLDMEFDPDTIARTFPAGTSRLSIGAEAKSSGTFPIEVSVRTPSGFTVASEAVQVRSTEFNVVALAITLGAVAFLILFYVVKAVRKRRGAAEASTN